MDVAVTVADNGLNRIPDSGSPLSPLNPDSMAFSTAANEGGIIINGNGGAMVSSSSVPPMPICSSGTLTTSTTGFLENGTQQQPQSHQFIHGK